MDSLENPFKDGGFLKRGEKYPYWAKLGDREETAL